MIVHVHADSRITLDDPDTFTEFSLRAPDMTLPTIVAAFGSDAIAGEDDHVWIAISRLHALGEIHGGTGWRDGCDGMLDYATSQGWVDEVGQRVRAHLED